MRRVITVKKLGECISSILNEPVLFELTPSGVHYYSQSNGVEVLWVSPSYVSTGYGEPFIEYNVLRQRFSDAIHSDFLTFDMLYYFTYQID